MTNNIMALADAYATAVNERTIVGRVRSRAALEAEIDRVCKDAERWQAYQARKAAAINAGLGRNPMRDMQGEAK